jgi:hypothetical protein
MGRGKAVEGKTTIQEIVEGLEDGIREIYRSGKYDSYLKTMSKFHRYSIYNNMLINNQMENATFLAGYQSWKVNFARNVKKGEKGIKIIAPFAAYEKSVRAVRDPVTEKAATGPNGEMRYEEVEDMVKKFKVAYVFDISQTEGQPLPMITEPSEGTVPEYNMMLKALCEVSELPVKFERMEGATEGLCYYGDRIAIRPGMSQVQTVAALAHELAHSRLHTPPQIEEYSQVYSLSEVQAESVAYTFCQYFGIDTKKNSFGYIIEWGKDRELKALHSSLELIRIASSRLIADVEDKMNELRGTPRTFCGIPEMIAMKRPAIFFDDFVSDGSEAV